MYIDVRQKYQQHKGDLDQFSYTYKLDIFIKNIKRNVKSKPGRGRHGRLVVRFTTTYVISVYHH